jgi:TonB family protein
MYFDFDDARPDTPTIARPLSSREGVLLSIIAHLMVVIALLVAPRLPWVQEAMERKRQELAEQARLEQERLRDQARFVFVQPKLEMRATPPPRADLSDLDRRARTVERAPNPTNPLPFARGNSPERIEADPGPAPKPAPPQPDPANNGDTDASRAPTPDAYKVPDRRRDASQTDERGPAVGVIANAIRNVQKYVPQEGFNNPTGGQQQDIAPSIQFDTKGVEFGPWLRRFIAQIRSNWPIPYAAMFMHGHVVVTFNVHKDGRITDIAVIKPSTVEAFTISARNAILASNPTVPLPPEYPDEKAFFTVTFFFNENPGR